MRAALSEKPHVVATVTQPGDLALLAPTENVDADILEFRLDNLVDSVASVKQTIETIGTPSLVTARHPDEGGANELSEDRRLELYRAVLPAAELVDVDIASLSTMAFESFVEEARSAETLVVGSYHDFLGFPGIDLIEERIRSAFHFQVDIAKIAVVMESLSDLFATAELVRNYSEAGHLVSAMGMGPLGKLSRLVLAKAGSCLNYGYLCTPNAPGQWRASDLKHLLGEI